MPDYYHSRARGRAAIRRQVRALLARQALRESQQNFSAADRKEFAALGRKKKNKI